MKTTISTEWLSGCSGCHVALVDLHEKLLNLMDCFEFVRIPVLMDEKGYPPADVGIIEGAIRSEHDREAALSLRKSVKTLIAFGTCAVYGGPSGIGWLYPPDAILSGVYKNGPTTAREEELDPALPQLEQSVAPVNEVVPIDLFLPGCPPHPSWIATALGALTDPQRHTLEQRTVCSQCERTMKKQEGVTLKTSQVHAADEKLCFLSQGVVCLGSVSMDRCLSPCPNRGIACAGCAGPSFDIVTEPHLDMRTMVARRMHMLTGIDTADIHRYMEQEAKTYYAYSMASPVIYNKPAVKMKSWTGSPGER
jgi:F420-non-reducing hydrogenase small subunit